MEHRGENHQADRGEGGLSARPHTLSASPSLPVHAPAPQRDAPKRSYLEWDAGGSTPPVGSMLCLFLLLALLPSCATKHYGRLLPVTPAEAAQYTCREIGLEQAKVEAWRTQTDTARQFDLLSVVSFGRDLGIGNLIEAHQAEGAYTARRAALERLKRERGCP